MKKKLLLFMLLSSIIYAQYEESGKRGIYFSKKNYTEASIPLFEKNKSNLPSPIIENNKEFVELYWEAWKLAFLHYKKPPQGSPFVSNYIDEAFSPSVFQWDTIFMIMFARYANNIFPAIQSLDNFYCRQYENGYMCREIWEATGEDYVYEGRQNTVNPPLFGWAELENFKLTGDKSRFAAILPVLEKYAEWLEKYRKKENTKHNLYWQTGLGSGMDNTPRSGSAWTDMSAQVAMLHRDILFICTELGLKEKAEFHSKEFFRISEQINKLMWNEEDGLYYDLDDESKQVKEKTIACFWPMLAGMCDQQKAEKLLANLKNPKTFWRTIPFPSLAADAKDYKAHGEYWQGGVWAPTNVMVIKGLDKFSFDDSYGYAHAFREFATYATQTYLDAMFKVYKQTGTIWENYSPEHYMRGLPAQPDFVGWSGCGPIMLLIENIIGIHADATKNEILWYLNRVDKHGIKNLTFGNVIANLICEKRDAVNKLCKITITTNKPFTLKAINWTKKTETFEIKKGTNNITVK